MRRVLMAAVVGVLSATASPALADILISIDKSAQRMVVSVNGERRHAWDVSTGRAGRATPVGTFTPFRLEVDHYSKEWDDAPMPHSIFFTKNGHAIHGSTELRKIGQPASAGCVRLAPQNAATLFALVKAEGLSKTRIVISGEEPSPALVAKRKAPADDDRTALHARANGGGEPLDVRPRGRALDRGYEERAEVEDYTARMRRRYYEERYEAYAPRRPRYYGRYYDDSPYYGRRAPLYDPLDD